MARTTKVTFTLDRVSVERLQEVSDQLALAKSEVVRDAIMDFYDRLGQMSNRERLAMLRTFDEVVPKIAPRSAAAVRRELAEIRQARRGGGRRTVPAASDRS